jgi:hypothetical protein
VRAGVATFTFIFSGLHGFADRRRRDTCLAATLSSMALMALTTPVFLLATTGTVTGEGIGPTMGAMVVMLPIEVVVGGTIALPVAALAGGAMLLWQRKRGTPFSARAWIVAGLLAGLLVSRFVGTNDADLARLVTAPWFACLGALGAWVFARVWGRSGAR